MSVRWFKTCGGIYVHHLRCPDLSLNPLPNPFYPSSFIFTSSLLWQEQLVTNALMSCTRSPWTPGKSFHLQPSYPLCTPLHIHTHIMSAASTLYLRIWEQDRDINKRWSWLDRKEGGGGCGGESGSQLVYVLRLRHGQAYDHTHTQCCITASPL